MTWGAIGGAAVATVGGAVLGGASGGGGSGATQTQSKEPWAPAAPWLTSLLGQGQNLQAQYQANPFNDLQRGAYGNLLQGNDYINQMVPGLLAQMSQPTGFDRNNPRARPQAYQFPQMQQMQQMQGLLGPSMGQATAVPPAAAAPAQQYITGAFGTVPAPQPIPGVNTPALPPSTLMDWARTLGTGNAGNQV